MIIIGSRYETADIAPVITGRKSTATVTVFRVPPEPTPPSQYFNWADGDRLDLLADRKFGTPREWWRVMDANQAILNPLDLAPGKKVYLP